MRDDLNGATQIIASSLFGNDFRIDLTSSDIGSFGQVLTSEAFIVTQVQIGLGSIVRDENFPVLIGIHGPRVNIEVGI
jgi:hypothetical protein